MAPVLGQVLFDRFLGCVGFMMLPFGVRRRGFATDVLEETPKFLENGLAKFRLVLF